MFVLRGLNSIIEIIIVRIRSRDICARQRYISMLERGTGKLTERKTKIERETDRQTERRLERGKLV